VASEPWRDQVSVFDTSPTFTPGGRYRDSMPIGGKATIVRQADGIHLNPAGAALLSQLMVAQLGQTFVF